MNRDGDRQKLFGRRAAVLAGGKFVLLSALVGRMYYLQVVEAERYATLADENRINMRLLAPPRGRIVDRFGVPLADNQQNYRVQMLPEDIQAADIAEVIEHLARIVPMDPVVRRRVRREIERSRGFVPVTVRENLSWSEVARIEVNAPELPGVMIDVGRSRRYPLGRDAAHLLGYVAAVSEKEMDGDPLLRLPGFRVGKAGMERVHDTKLRGSGGSSQVEVNAYGRMIRELSRQEGQAGAEVVLTVDAGLQRAASRLLEEQSAAAAVIDVLHGDVLALVSTPSFDPDAFNRGLTGREWRDLIGNERAPLSNKAIAGQYAPGSTFKMMVLLAALEKGVITPDSHFFCKGYVELGDARFHCWRKHGHGLVNAERGIEQSCDVYFYEIAKRTGIDRISAMARKFGLGDVLDLDLSGEKTGLMPDRKWKRKTFDEPWHQGETLIAGIGQGYVLTTPLQLAVMTARIANGGLRVMPRLTHAVTGTAENPAASVPTVEDIGINGIHLALVRDAMDRVVNQPTGTAFRARIQQAEWAMAGKTGTAQVRRISKAEREQGVRKNKDLDWKQRDHALFVGYAPVEKPRYAVAVIVEHGGGGSKVAAPIARDILLEAQRRRSGRSSTAAGTGVQASRSPDRPGRDEG